MRQRLIPELGSVHQTKQLFIQAQSTLQAWLCLAHTEGRSPLCQLTRYLQGFWAMQSPHSICGDVGNEFRKAGGSPAVPRVAAGGCRDQLCAGGQELPAELEEKPYDLRRPFRALCAPRREGFYFQQNLGRVLSLFLAKLECNKAEVPKGTASQDNASDCDLSL